MQVIRSVYVSLPDERNFSSLYVLATYNSSVLMQIGTEPLRSKLIFTFFLSYIIMLKKVLYLYLICAFINMNPLF